MTHFFYFRHVDCGGEGLRVDRYYTVVSLHFMYNTDTTIPFSSLDLQYKGTLSIYLLYVTQLLANYSDSTLSVLCGHYFV